MSQTPTYIFTWNDIEARNGALIQALTQPLNQVILVASEDGPSDDQKLRIGRDAHYGEQFRAALRHYREKNCSGGCMMVVGDMQPKHHAQRAATNGRAASLMAFPRGDRPFIYAPYVHGTWQPVRPGNVRPPAKDLLCPALFVDGSCWFFNEAAIKLAESLPPMHYGYGLDLVMCGATRERGGAVVMDFGCHMVNPPGSGYHQGVAAQEMKQWFKAVDAAGIPWRDEFKFREDA